MLQMLRSAAAGWVAKVLIGLLVISFAIFGVGNSIFNSGGDVVASVGDTDVPLSRFSGELNREINQVSQQLGHRWMHSPWAFRSCHYYLLPLSHFWSQQ